jgi:hypothetical protein
MKEAYFQPDTLQFLSSQWLEKFGRPNKVLRQPFKIQDACLVIISIGEQEENRIGSNCGQYV